jgi:hypothetical protein
MWEGKLVIAVVPWLGASCEPEDGNSWDWLGTREDHAGELMISVFLDGEDEDGDDGEAWEVDEYGDGRDDVLLGAPSNVDGKAYLFLGASLGPNEQIDVSEADYIFVGEHQDHTPGI